jgi:hypothetical protein
MFENKQFKSKKVFFLLENFKMEKLLSLLWLKIKFRKNETVKIPLKREFQLFFTNKTMLSVFFIAPIFYALLGFTYKRERLQIFL